MISVYFKSFFLFFLFFLKKEEENVILKISGGSDYKKKAGVIFQEIERIKEIRREVCDKYGDTESGIMAFNAEYPQEYYQLELMTKIYFCNKIEINSFRRILEKEENFNAKAYNNACVRVRSYL